MPPHILSVEVLTPSASGCDLVRKRSLYIGTRVTVRSLGGALIQYNWCPCGREIWKQTPGGTPCEQEGRWEASAIQGVAKIAGTSPEARERHERMPPVVLLTPCSWVSGLQAWESATSHPPAVVVTGALAISQGHRSSARGLRLGLSISAEAYERGNESENDSSHRPSIGDLWAYVCLRPLL